MSDICPGDGSCGYVPETKLSKASKYILNFASMAIMAFCLWLSGQIFSMQNTAAKISSVLDTTTKTVERLQTHQEDLSKEVSGLQVWSAGVDASKFTVEDGKEVWKEIAVMRESMARMTLVEPPTWLLERIERLEARINHLEETK